MSASASASLDVSAGHDPREDQLPRLRDGVKFVPRKIRGRPATYLVANARTDAVLELGEKEYFLCRQLDGRMTDAEIRARYRARYGAALSITDFGAFLRQIGEQGLLEGTEPSPRQPSFAELFTTEEVLPVPQLCLMNGNVLFAWLAQKLRWCFTWPVHVLAGAAVVLGLAILLSSWSELTSAVQTQFGLAFFLVCFVCTSLIPSVRMTAHGVACKRYGGQVTDVGVLLLYYFSPSLYCDWSSAVWLRRKSERFSAIFAGVGAHLVLWAVATIGWWLADPDGVASMLWLALSVTAGFTFLLSTGNPLVKMQAYLLLLNWLEIPRLHDRALAVWGSWLGWRALPEPLSRKERFGFLIYGLLGFAYFAVVLLVSYLWLGTKLTANFDQGGGAVAALALGVFMVHRPLGRLLGRPRRLWARLASPSGGRRWAVRVALLFLVVVILLIPYPYETGGPFNMIPELRTEVHCEIDGGRIAKVFVHEGELVTAGQPLAKIDPREYERNLQATRAQLDEVEARLRLLRKELALLNNPPNIETIQALEAEARRLRTVEADFQQQLDLTTLRAPIGGRVTTPLIEQSAGRYLKRGDLFAAVEQARAVQVEIQVPEGDAPQVKLGARVKVVPWAYPYETFYGTVREIAPIALPPPGSNITTKSVRVVADIQNPDARLKSQLTGYAKIKADVIPIWLVLSRLIGRWLAVQFWYWLP